MLLLYFHIIFIENVWTCTICPLWRDVFHAELNSYWVKVNTWRWQLAWIFEYCHYFYECDNKMHPEIFISSFIWLGIFFSFFFHSLSFVEHFLVNTRTIKANNTGNPLLAPKKQQSLTELPPGLLHATGCPTDRIRICFRVFLRFYSYGRPARLRNTQNQLI